MLAHRWLLALAISSAMAAAIASGCGGMATSAGPTDSGAPDVTAERTAEAAPEAAPEAAAPPEAGAPQDAACAVDADIAALTVPDAALGDSGVSTGGCYSCIQNGCSEELVLCNSDCTCKTDALTFLACVASGGDPATCGVPLLTGSIAGLGLAECVGGPATGGSGAGCLQACGANPPGAAGPADGGGSDAASGDAASGDAASGDAAGP